MWPFKRKTTMQIEPMKCKTAPHQHDYVITGCPNPGVWAYCNRCGMRTPVYPWYNGAWAVDLFARAEREGTLYQDTSLIYRGGSS